MDTLNPDEITKAYKNAISLPLAISQFGSPELMEQLSKVREINQPNFSSNSILETLSEGLQAFQDINSSQLAQKEIIEKLKDKIISRVQKGELIAMGLKMPLDMASKPIEIPAHLFSGEINWEKSELKNGNLEFSQIRLSSLKESPSDDNLEIRAGLTMDYCNPELLINEDKAANFLGISKRTLQGYRWKGGGPLFLSLGKKAIRYKIADLILWRKERKNTTS